MKKKLLSTVLSFLIICSFIISGCSKEAASGPINARKNDKEEIISEETSTEFDTKDDDIADISSDKEEDNQEIIEEPVSDSESEPEFDTVVDKIRIQYTPTEEDRAYRNTECAVNGSFIARNSSYIFYNSNNCITRMTSDFKEKSIILEGEYPCIYLIDDKLFFLRSQDEAVYCSDMNGDNVKKILTDSIKWFYVDDNYIYYVNRYSDATSGIYRTDTDGNNKVQITDINANYVYVADDFLVYYNETTKEVIKADLDGQNAKVVFLVPDNDTLNELHIYKGNIYLVFDNYDNMDACGINLLNPDTQELSRIVYDKNASNLFFWNDRVYYYSSDVDATVHYELNGDNPEWKQMIFSNQVYSCVVLGDMLYSYGYNGNGKIAETYLIPPVKSRVIENTVYNDIIFSNGSLYLKHSNDCFYKNTIGTNGIVKVFDNDDYTKYTSKDGKLYFFKRDGLYLIKEYDILELRFKGVYSATLFNDDYSFYYADNADIYCSTSGDEEHLFMEEPASVYGYKLILFDGEWLYYEHQTQNTITYSKINVNDQSNEVIYEIETKARPNRLGPIYHDGKIYYNYIDEDLTYHFYSMNPDESDKKLLSDDMIDLDSVKFLNEYIYYRNINDNRIYKMDLEGKGVEKLINFPCEAFTIDEDNNIIYYINRYEDGDIFQSDLNGADIRLTLAVDNNTEEISERIYGKESENNSSEIKEAYNRFFYENFSFYDDQVALADVTHDGVCDMVVIHKENEGQYSGYVYTIIEGKITEIYYKYGETVHVGGFFNWFLVPREDGWNLGEESFAMWQGYGTVGFSEYYFTNGGEMQDVAGVICPQDESETDADGKVTEEAMRNYYDKLDQIKPEFYCMFSSFDEPSAMTLNSDPFVVFEHWPGYYFGT